MNAKELVKHFANEYHLKTGNKYVPVWKRDIPMMNQVLEFLSGEEIFKCVSQYFGMYDEQYNIGYFKYKINDILSAVNKPEPKKMQNNDSWRF